MNILEMAYQKGREDAMAELWKKAISRYDCMFSLEELDELIEQIKEQKNDTRIKDTSRVFQKSYKSAQDI